MLMLSEIIRLCKMYGIRLDPNLSQNFLHAKHIFEREIRAAAINEEDIVLDIGAGFGFLTEMLASIAKKVYAIELDTKIANVFRHRLGRYIDEGKVELIVGDVLKVELPKDVTKIVSNPPFHIISPLIFKLAQTYFIVPNFKVAVLIVQLDYAKKLIAKPGEKRSRISATIQYFSDVELLMRISRKNFFPTPEVDAALIRMRPKRTQHIVSFETYSRVVTLLFSTPNKMLRKALSLHLPSECVRKIVLAMQSYDIQPRIRVRDLSNQQLEIIAKIVEETGCIKNLN